MTDEHRLNDNTLGTLPDSVARPAYDRKALATGIVHLGIGAFMRAHMAAATEAAIAAGDLRWGILGVSLRQSDTRDALAPQDGLYTLAIRDADAQGQARQRLQVIGAVRTLLVAPENPQAVLDAIAATDTRIVSLTVTEKGYCHDPATGDLRLDHPDTVHDLANPHAPRSAIGMLVYGLQRRYALGHGALTLMSLDNLPANGRVLRAAVLRFATETDPTLADRIASDCRFPCSMVDRIVPKTTDGDRAEVSQALGSADAWPVMGEPFFDWAIEDQFAADRPDWTRGGARFVKDAEPFERLKLRMVNGTHSSLAYLGAMAGWQTVDQAIGRAPLREHIEALMRDEIEPTLPALPGLDLVSYRTNLLARYANPALAHRTHQIAMDGSQKLPQRLLGTVRDRLARQLPVTRMALALAAWMHYLRGVDELGQSYRIDDPHASELTTLYQQTLALGVSPNSVQTMLGYAPVFGDLAGNAALTAALVPLLTSLQVHGVVETLEAVNRGAPLA
ncbi:mannitol dehydrogenase [Hydrogenophaga crassostreae]|uniref:Mannitol dehydrogenase n=1 Tax=Hydrogenophaga crassostreae TaxID=1763535 RepID=A0A162SV69_9BURK|nr:mannitol dehydrogenase family protein [Hydrogenophaga crassostreae]AOW15418.1 mannitol dehydrogenase [Hydrogenophaga crassostreae]OAD40627.1 mannitol dehydrogenase [Hydrogenophaga crassostreae]